MSKLRSYGTRQDRYSYKRMMTGLNYYIEKKRIIRFLTLTGVDNEKGYRRNFNKLRRVLRRRFGFFEYFAIRTNEGTAGVLHLLYVGLSFKYGELRDYWQKLTGHWTISISRVKNFKSIGFEMTRQMCAVRYSQSRNWYQGKTKEVNIWFEGTPLMSKKKVMY